MILDFGPVGKKDQNLTDIAKGRLVMIFLIFIYAFRGTPAEQPHLVLS
jgi:hypothetical protein